MSRFDGRRKAHDKAEEKVMDIIRPFTTRRHLPDRWVAFNNKLCAWDMKTTIFVEDNSRNEYFRLISEGIPVFIVYQNDGITLAEWVQRLVWIGPLPPTKKSTSGDPYYRISGGISLLEFLEKAKDL